MSMALQAAISWVHMVSVGRGMNKRSTSAVVKSQSKQKSKHNNDTLSYQLYEYYLPRDKVLNQAMKAS